MLMSTHILMPTRSMHFHGAGGMEMIVWDLAREFVLSGLRVTLLTTKIPDRPQKFSCEGVEIVALPDTKPGRYSTAWWRESKRYFLQELRDVNSVLSISAGAFGLLNLRSRFPNTRFIMQAHGTLIGEILSKWRSGLVKAWVRSLHDCLWLPRDLRAYPKFDFVVACGEAVEAALLRPPISIVLPRNKVVLICNGIDTRHFAPNQAAGRHVRKTFGWTDEHEVVVSASRLHRQKGLHLSLSAFGVLGKRRPQARYLVIGDGPERILLERQARSLGLAERVVFCGSLPREEVPAYLNAGDAFLFTTLRAEGLPLNVLEALATGLPVVASTHLSHHLPGTEVGALSHADDVAELAALVERALHASHASRSDRRSLLPETYSLRRCNAAYLDLLAR